MPPILPILLLLLLSSLQISKGCLTLNGQTPVFQDYEVGAQDGFSAQTHAISRDLQFSCYGDVIGWAAYAERSVTFTNIKFQVWRLTQIVDTSNDCRTYQLVGSHSFSSISATNNLLNITSLGGQNPIPVQPGDVVGFYGELRRNNVNIQSNPSTNYLSYYNSGVTSSTADALREANTCSDLQNREEGVPVITAYVINQASTTEPVFETTTQSATTFTEPTTQLRSQPPQTTSMAISTASPPLTTTIAQLTTTTVGDLQQTTSGLATTTHNQEQTASRVSTTGHMEFSTGIGSETTLNEGTMLSTKAGEGTSESTQQQLSTDDAQQKEEEGEPISTILILSVVIALVSGIVLVIVCLVVGRCVCRRLRYKQRRFELTPLSLNVPDGNRDRSESHIYCEVTRVLEKKDDCTLSFSDMDNKAAFKQLDCSCKIPHRSYPSADYEVPMTTIQRSQAKLYQPQEEGGKKDFENTYETPLDAKTRMLEGLEGAGVKDSDRERKRLDSIYDVPRPVQEEEEEYTFMASVPLESGFSEATDDIYENVAVL